MLLKEVLAGGVSQIFRNLETQTLLNHEQRLKLNNDGRPCPKVTLKNRTLESVYGPFSWIRRRRKKGILLLVLSCYG